MRHAQRTPDLPGCRSVEDWAAHWNAKSGIEDPVELNGYSVAGAPLDRDLCWAAIIEPCLARLELEPHHHVLEVGCGSGLILREIEARVERAAGTDLSDVLIRRYSGMAETYVSAAHELPFEDRQFDRILMASVSQYFPSLAYFRQAVAALVELLRHPGILLIGDVLLGSQPPATPYRWYQPMEIIDILEQLKVRFSIETQSELKRTINRRYDVLVRTSPPG